MGEARARDRAGLEAGVTARRNLDDLEEDIRDHLERETQDNIYRGMTPDAARTAARRAFGNVTLVMEDTRAIWIPSWFDQSLCTRSSPPVRDTKDPLAGGATRFDEDHSLTSAQCEPAEPGHTSFRHRR